MLLFLNKKKWFKRPRIILLAAIIVFLLAMFYAFIGLAVNNNESEVEAEKVFKVTAQQVGDLIRQNNIDISGVVKSDTRVEVVALSNGTVRKLNAKVGDQVVAGQVLVELYNDKAFTNLNNAASNLNNLQLNLETTRRLAQDSVRQAELGLQNSQKSYNSAQIALKSAQDNLQNIFDLQKREKADLQASVVIAVNGYLNTINTTLDQVNYIIKADGDSQLPGLAPTLAALNGQSLVSAKNSYSIARSRNRKLLSQEINSENINSFLIEIYQNLTETKKAVDDTIWVLDSTVTSLTFTDAALLNQKNIFAGLRSNIVAAQSQAKVNQQTLQNIDLVQKQQFDSLQSAWEAARNQLELAEVYKLNAQVSYEQAQRSRDQQVLSAQTALDNSQGQFALIQNQVSDLTVSAPISGQVIESYIEVGNEVNSGKPLLVIAQSNLVKIEANLTSEDIYKIELGQTAIINNKFIGTIIQIDPVADPITRQVGIEIAYDNTNQDLIPETFVDVSLPVMEDGNGLSERLFVPLKAVTITQTDQFVYTVLGDLANRVIVEIGKVEGENVEILSGLTRDDLLIIEGAKFISAGDKIEVIRQ